MKKRLWLSIAGSLAASAVGSAAHAATVYNTSLASPGVYFGTGNSGQNFGWTVNTENGVELGLTTIHAFVGGLNPTTNNIYNVPTGNAGGAHTNRAYWNFDFSVNLLNSGLTIQNISATLTVLNIGNGLSVTGDPLLAFPDTQGWSGSSVDSPYTSTDIGFQNSENLVFSQFAGLSFDENANDTYLITLSLSDPDGLLDSVDEYVVAGTGATPLPAALPLFASGLGVTALLARRRKRKKPAAMAPV
jgi:hypothetical protein